MNEILDYTFFYNLSIFFIPPYLFRQTIFFKDKSVKIILRLENATLRPCKSINFEIVSVSFRCLELTKRGCLRSLNNGGSI